jgi:predicted nucleic acid-binding protein
MKDRVFLDTNILVYAYDRHDRRKQEVAQKVLSEGLEHDSAVLSVQVLSEFFNVVTRRIEQPMSPQEAKTAIELFSNLMVLEIDLAMIYQAIDHFKTYRVSYWDSLIVAAAERGRCKSILSEDLNEGQLYGGIEVRNPFRKLGES